MKMVPILINRGYNVVYVAEWAQGDEWWLREALGRGCEIFVSRDGDVRNFADANEVLCITPKRGLGGDDLMMSIVQRLDVAVSRIK